MKKDETQPEDIKPDLKHDTMEYAASTDGDDIIEADLIEDEDEELTAEELAFIEDMPFDEQAAALNSVENDRKSDDDVIFDDNDIDEALDEIGDEDEEDERDEVETRR